jgi:hypothetical protein
MTLGVLGGVKQQPEDGRRHPGPPDFAAFVERAERRSTNWRERPIEGVEVSTRSGPAATVSDDSRLPRAVRR